MFLEVNRELGVFLFYFLVLGVVGCGRWGVEKIVFFWEAVRSGVLGDS